MDELEMKVTRVSVHSVSGHKELQSQGAPYPLNHWPQVHRSKKGVPSPRDPLSSFQYREVEKPL